MQQHCLHQEILKIKSTLQNPFKRPRSDSLSLGDEGYSHSRRQSEDNTGGFGNAGGAGAQEDRLITDSSGIFSQTPSSSVMNLGCTGGDRMALGGISCNERK